MSRLEIPHNQAAPTAHETPRSAQSDHPKDLSPLENSAFWALLVDRLAQCITVSVVPRLALSREEAAQALGISVDFFDQHVRPDVRTVQRGGRVLVPLKELERFLDNESACY